MSIWQSQRAERLRERRTRRAESRQRAVDRGEFYVVRQRREETHAAHVKRACDAALDEPITFLPKLPAAAALARRSWASQQIPEDEGEREEALRLVNDLSDDLGTLSTVVAAWAKPSAGKSFMSKLKGGAKDAKGLAPRSKDFRQASVLAKKGRAAAAEGGAPTTAPGLTLTREHNLAARMAAMAK